MRFFLESREFGESRVYQVWSPIGSTQHRLSSPKRKPVKQTQVTRAHQAKKADFSMVSLRKSVTVRFLYQTGASRTQLNTASRPLVTPSCCTNFKFLVDRISGEHFPPNNYGKGPWESMLSQHCWTGLPSHPQRVVAQDEVPRLHRKWENASAFRVSRIWRGKKPPIRAWYILFAYIYV